MKIILKRTEKLATYVTDCSECGTVFEIEQGDKENFVTNKYVDNFGKQADASLMCEVPCPNCGHEQLIETEFCP